MDLLDNCLIFDTETTGLEASKDQIIEICIQFGAHANSEQRVWRFRPDVPISSESQAVHGITIEQLADCPKFSSHADEIYDIFCSAKNIIGYNVLFDIGFLQAEFRRAKKNELDLSKVQFIDPSVLWRRMEPRSLSAAHERFVGKPLDCAHSASADVRGTGNVFIKMLECFNLNDIPEEELFKKSNPVSSAWIGPSSHFQWRGKLPVFGFGKHRNRSIHDVAKEDGGSYLSWLAGSDFPTHVKQIAKAAPKQSPNEFKSWLVEKFGGPTSDTSATENSAD